MKKITATLIAISLFSGCAVYKQYANLSPKEKAVVSVETLSSWYYNTYQGLEKKYATATPEEREYLEKIINPKMNAIKPLIIKYNKLVLLWQETNTEPENLTALVDEIQRLVFDVIDALK